MGWNVDTLNQVYDKTDGYCRYCEKRIYWKNYGRPVERGAWEIDHSIPKAQGGTDRLSNLWPACVVCNRDKGTLTGSQYKAYFHDEEEDWSLGEAIVTGIGLLALGALASHILRNIQGHVDTGR